MSSKRRRSHFSPVLFFTFIAGACCALATVFLVRNASMHWALGYLLAVNAVTFCFYGYDKLISGRKLLRIPEKTLHTLAFLGGTPLAFVAQKLFRHKTVKRAFRVTFWILAIIQAALIVWALWYFYWR